MYTFNNMKRPTSIVLPICITPIVVENNFMAMQYSVFQAFEKDLTPVLANYYINIVSGQDNRVQFSHLHEDKWLVKEQIMLQHHMIWHKEMFNNRPDELIALIQQFISHRYYLTGNYDAFYIKAKPAYQCYNTNTVYLIYGYNNNDNVFYAVGKTKNSTFESYAITYNDYLLSVFNRDNGLFNLNFIKFNDDCKIKTNFNKVYDGIYDYLHSICKQNGVIPEGNAIAYRYGLRCYRDFLKALTTQHEYRRYIEPSSYSVFLEHHILMQKRIDYLMSIGIPFNKDYSSDYKKIVELSKNVFDTILCYNASFDPLLIKIMANDLRIIIENEYNILIELLEKIKCYKTTCTIIQ